MAIMTIGTTRRLQLSQTARPILAPAQHLLPFPLQSKPLMYSLDPWRCPALFKVIFFLPDALGILIVEIGILLAALALRLQVTARARAHLQRRGPPPRPEFLTGRTCPTRSPNRHAQSMVVGWLPGVTPPWGTLAWLVMCFCCPPRSRSCWCRPGSFVRPLNLPTPGTPLLLWLAYLLLCVFLFPAGPERLHRAGPAAAALQGLDSAAHRQRVAHLVFSWVMASLLAYAMYQNHGNLQHLTCCPAQAWTMTRPPWITARHARLSKTPSTPRWHTAPPLAI